MKKVFFLLALLIGLSMNQGFAQDAGSSEHYTIGDLDKLGKLDLTKLYVDQVHKISMLLPYVPFNQKGDAVSLAGMGIPSTKDNNGFIKKLDASGGSHNEALDETLNNIIPYADKADIIKSILFLQTMIEKIETGI
ncbi:MAG: hypothetical protein AAF570_21860 [Bacteroidota bacterium]